MPLCTEPKKLQVELLRRGLEIQSVYPGRNLENGIVPALFLLGRDPGFNQSLKQASFVQLEGCYLSIMV